MAATLWEWFVVPYGALLIGTIHAAGVMLLVRLVTRSGETDVAAAAASSVVWPPIVLGMGWLLTQFT